jgi:hypothetical protein
MLLLLMPQVSYHCKNGYDYGSPDPVDILPSSCSSLCLATITNMAFAVLTYLSPSSPDTPAIKQRKGQADPEQTLNNPSGYAFPYGGLQFVAAASDEPQHPAAQRGRVGDGLADIVSDAVSGAGFIKACWAILKARFGIAGEATACSKWSWWPRGCACHAKTSLLLSGAWCLVLRSALGWCQGPLCSQVCRRVIQCFANAKLLDCWHRPAGQQQLPPCCAHGCHQPPPGALPDSWQCTMDG